MSLTLIFLLIALGLILLLLEVFVIPGTSVFGIVGGVLIIFSIWQAYKVFGSDKGNIIVLVTVALIVATLVLAFKSNTWKRMMLNTNVEGRVNVIEENKLHVGDIGKTISRISPAGTAIFDNELYEVHTQGDFIDQETEIIISKLEDNKIFVKRK
ncbi:MAG: NfeD family protein [Omnitrophica WOR_2 bacterium]|jgi:membrane-bound ClpP family serine protease